MKHLDLLTMSTHDVAREGAQLAFWAVGTIEAHDLGPVGTDVIAPQKLVSELAPTFEALVLPTLPYGLVTSLAGYPGSVWMTEATYRRVIHELLSSLVHSGVTAVVVFNGHGGNTSALGRVLPEVWKDTGIRTALIDWWTAAGDLSDQMFGSAGGHAGADELAVVRAADPALVPETWDGSRAYATHPGVRAYPAPRSALRFGDGPATPLSAEGADAYYRALCDRLRELVRDILDGWSALRPSPE